MKKLILSTKGKVFTPKTLDRLVENTGLSAFRTKLQRRRRSDLTILHLSPIDGKKPRP